MAIINQLPVKFDPNEINHRAAFYKFLKTYAWGADSIRFVLESPYVDVPSMIQIKLLNWYMDNELSYINYEEK